MLLQKIDGDWKLVKRKDFSIPFMLVFALVFGAIGVRFLLSGHAMVPSPAPEVSACSKAGIIDTSIMISNYSKSGAAIAGDFNNDGKVDVFDLSILLSHCEK